MFYFFISLFSHYSQLWYGFLKVRNMKMLLGALLGFAALAALPVTFAVLLLLRKKSTSGSVVPEPPMPVAFCELLPAYSERPHYIQEPQDAIVEETDRQRIERIRKQLSTPSTLTPSKSTPTPTVIRKVEDRKSVEHDHELKILN